MAIPSYDDLTPSIPDVSPGDVFTSVAPVLPTAGAEDPWAEVRSAGVSRPGAQARHELSSPGESGHLTPVNCTPPCTMPMGRIERLMAIARDFSPRIERHPGGTVVLDVSGLQRLFGDPRSIAEHLARAGAPQVGDRRVADGGDAAGPHRPRRHVAAGDPGVALRTVPLADPSAAGRRDRRRRLMRRPADRVRLAADRHAPRGRSTSCGGGG